MSVALKIMDKIVNFLLDKLNKNFWLSIFLSCITLLYCSNKKSNLFSFEFFESNSGIAKAVFIFLIVFSFYQILFVLIEKVKNFFVQKEIENQNFIDEQNKIKMDMIVFLERLFNIENKMSFFNEINCNELRFYIKFIYENNIKTFSANDIFALFEKEANEKQKLNSDENTFYFPYISQKGCVKIQNFLLSYNFLFFDGEKFNVNPMLFEKLKELENRGILELN